MGEDDSRNLWLFLCFLEVDKEYFHEIAEHSGNAHLNKDKVTSPPPKLIGHSSRVYNCCYLRRPIKD